MVFTSSERCDESEEAKKSTLSRIPTAGTVMKRTETANRKKNTGIWMKTRVGDTNSKYGFKSLGCLRKKSSFDTSFLWPQSELLMSYLGWQMRHSHRSR